MKKLVVEMQAGLEVTDDRELARHSPGITVLKVGDAFVDFDLAHLATAAGDADAEWPDIHVEVVEAVLDAVTGLDADIAFITQH
jgi:hypothetical protein